METKKTNEVYHINGEISVAPRECNLEVAVPKDNEVDHKVESQDTNRGCEDIFLYTTNDKISFLPWFLLSAFCLMYAMEQGPEGLNGYLIISCLTIPAGLITLARSAYRRLEELGWQNKFVLDIFYYGLGAVFVPCIIGIVYPDSQLGEICFIVGLLQLSIVIMESRNEKDGA